MNSKKIHKVLIANRGEIAVRVIKTLRKLHVASVAVFADNDANALHRRMADEACPLGGGTLKDTYLNIQKIIDAALDTGADAIHPGYGFLSESPELAEACEANNLIFIGPDAKSMRLMGNKIAARKIAVENGIPVTFGMMGGQDEILEQADSLPYPILIKAAAGGGGKGMHIVWEKSDLRPEMERAAREAEKYFGNGTVFIEQYIENPRHVEVQVLADHFGNVIHLHERECTIQRRYQKIIEESPSPTLTEEKRRQLCETAVKLCKAIGYRNAGTVEFLVDKDLNFYFLEINTRIQVEHPVTEMRTGVDIVDLSIASFLGEEMSLAGRLEKERFLSTMLLYMEPGVFGEVTGLDKLLSDGTVDYGVVLKRRGDLVGPDRTSSNRAATLLMTADSKAELEAKRKAAREGIDILNLDGVSRMARENKVHENSLIHQ